jgi:hypothetical protein
VSYSYPAPWGEFREQMVEEYATMYKWFNEAGYEVDIRAV